MFINNVKKFLSPFKLFVSNLKFVYKEGTKIEKIVATSWGIFLILLLLLSYTQADLGLVISRVPWLYAIERQFQYIGYFNRPLSTFLFCLMVIVFFSLYLYTLRIIHLRKISFPLIVTLIGLTAIILTFSYNMLSYDLFNYIFDARILTYYHQNPYLHKAQDYPHDPMLGFMRWTNRTYAQAYGPLWLLITLPFSFVGMHIFILTFYLFKILMTSAYLGTVFYLYKILDKLYQSKKSLGIVLFALNPLVVLESLVSSHNDIVMMFFAVFGFYLLINKRFWWAVLLLIASALIKYATIVLLPIFIWIYFIQKKGKDSIPFYLLNMMVIFMIGAITLAIFRTEFQPWYLMYVVTFLPLLQNKYLKGFIVLLTFLAQLTYLPYLFTGLWSSFWFIDQELAYMYIMIAASVIGGLYSLKQIYNAVVKP